MRALRIVASLLIACVAPRLSAQSDDLANGPPAPTIGAGAHRAAGIIPEAHAWFVVPVLEPDAADPGAQPAAGPSTDPERVLLHIPPREAAVHGGVPGLGRRSRAIESPPIGIAAAGRRVYLLAETPRASAEGAARYSVRSIEAWPTAVPGIWADRPSGRMESLPPLDLPSPASGTDGSGSDPEIVGFAATDEGPAALIRTAAGYEIARFDGEAWAFSPLPGIDPSAGDADPVLLASPRRLAVVGRSWMVLSTDAPSDATAASEPDADQPGWTRSAIDLDPRDLPVGLVGRSVVVWTPSPAPSPAQAPLQSAAPADTDTGAPATTSATIALVSAAGRETLGSVATPGSLSFLGLAVMPDQNGRLVCLRGERITDDEASARRGVRAGAVRYDLVEISLSTGDVLYEGPIDRVSPVSAEEFRILAAALIMMMVVSLVVVLRPIPGETELTVPDGCALATPARRLFATMLDLILCVLIVSRVSGVPFEKIVGLEVLIATDRSWLTLPAVLFVGMAYATITETVLAATLGKLIVGCRVARAPRDGGPPMRIGFARTLVRNGVKWILPPAASLALIEPTGRHRGDYLAGALVVVRRDDEQAEAELVGPADIAIDPHDLDSEPDRDADRDSRDNDDD